MRDVERRKAKLKTALDAIVQKIPQTSDFTIHDATSEEIAAIDELIYKMRIKVEQERKGFVGGLTPQTTPNTCCACGIEYRGGHPQFCDRCDPL